MNVDSMIDTGAKVAIIVIAAVCLMRWLRNRKKGGCGCSAKPAAMSTAGSVASTAPCAWGGKKEWA